MAVKVWHHTSLAVTDLDMAIAFYRAAFDCQIIFEERGMAGQIAAMTGIAGLTCDLAQLRMPVSDHVLELIAFRGPQVPAADARPLRPAAAHIAFYVDDVDAAVAKVESLGAVRLGAITRFDEGRSVYCRAPGGSFFELEELKQP